MGEIPIVIREFTNSSLLVLVSMLLTACAAEETSTSVPSTDIPPMADEPTMEATATEEVPDGTETVSLIEEVTPGVPVTGDDNPGRLSNQLDFNV